jgi:hypothetical protein
MEYIENIDWVFNWRIVKDKVIPHSGILIFTLILFLLLGFTISLTPL